ncbi:ATP-binding cassette domain-containing protein [Rathayibacter sp. VKM Ac-2929]|uniref:ATP-binding cassette domain-containing protein n=1 Tax=Rathayibacter sp. VKM Ac-2929 TaxID=2929480 RepID=UPI001FB3B5A5|nr:ATP-binding cassette domain-containing protein [Rathayibacter sp. VKM Ac-2929]MCJ1674572.1 ATP-binding cassette domain-containing protein [Rathayibacter sp. VKM Ac-2929]
MADTLSTPLQEAPNLTVPALSLRGVTKTYPGVKALDQVDFECRPGEVHALVGENGSGKSTLIKVASGVLTPDSGEVRIGGELSTGSGVKRARILGLGTAYQDTSLVHELSVADNIALSYNAIGKPCPDDLVSILGTYTAPFAPTDIVDDLGPGSRQLLEVVRAMIQKPHVLILDEPTAALDMNLAAHLEHLIQLCRKDGMAIIYVSHRLAEVRRLADRLTVIRSGVIQGTYDADDWDVDTIVELMVGVPADLKFPDRLAAPSDKNRLEAVDLTGPSYGPVSFSVRGGEIVGFAGAEGNGQRALLRGVIGLEYDSGTILIDDAALSSPSPSSALKAGISFQSGDRAIESVFAPLSVMDNVTTQLGSDAGPVGTAPGGRLRTAFAAASKQLNIVAASPYQPIGALSGGNQQKAVLARPALKKPKVLIVDEPTQGVDALARMDIYRMLVSAAEEGVAVVVNSSDAGELAGLCDRVYVMSRGQIVEEIIDPPSEAAIVRSFVNTTDTAATRTIRKPTFFEKWKARLPINVPVLILVALIAVVAIYTGINSDVFWSSRNLANLLLATLPLAIVALGQQLALLSGGFDISIGSTMSLTVVAMSFTLPSLEGGPILVTVLVLLAIALAIGGLNALMVIGLKVNSVVATIGTLGIVAGTAIVLRPQSGGIIAPDLGSLASLGVAFIPAPFAVLVAVAIGLEIWLTRSTSGLALRAAGFNEEASSRIGWNVNAIRSRALILCALGAVVAGVFLASQTGVGSNAVGSSYSLACFTAVFLGGAVMTGGRGSFIGALLGSIFISLLNNAMPFLNVPPAVSQMVNGGILVIAISLYAILARARARR